MKSTEKRNFKSYEFLSADFVSTLSTDLYCLLDLQSSHFERLIAPLTNDEKVD